MASLSATHHGIVSDAKVVNGVRQHPAIGLGNGAHQAIVHESHAGDIAVAVAADAKPGARIAAGPPVGEHLVPIDKRGLEGQQQGRVRSAAGLGRLGGSRTWRGGSSGSGGEGGRLYLQRSPPRRTGWLHTG